MRKRILRKDNVIGYNYHGLSFKNIVVREEHPVDEFYFEKSICPEDNTECVAITDPIRMLFNQKRLDSIGSTAIDSWIDSLNRMSHDPLAEMRSKCSDEDLRAIIKSRHIQQPSELMAYVEDCNANMDNFTKEVQAYLDAQKQNTEVTTQVDNSKTE